MSINLSVRIAIVVSTLAFIFAGWLYKWVNKQPLTDKEIAGIGKLIRNAVHLFMKKMYKVMAVFIAVFVLAILFVLINPIWGEKFWNGGFVHNAITACAYLFGAILPTIAGLIGVRIGTRANTRAAEAAETGKMKLPFLISFRSGAVTGMAATGVGLLGISLVILIAGPDNPNLQTYLLGFSLGASALALFAKAGGGIQTKVADIGSDYSSKLMAGLPEDSPNNPGTIADNGGDFNNEILGATYDIVDSNVAAMIAGLGLAATLGGAFVSMLLFYAAMGLLACIVGIATARTGKSDSPGRALNLNTYVSGLTFVALTAIGNVLFGFEWRLWGVSVVGLAVSIVIGLSTDFFTNDARKPVRETAKACEDGAPFAIVTGVGYAFLSVIPMAFGIGLLTFASYQLSAPLGEGYGIFGIAMAATGMLSIVGSVIANDAFGPISDTMQGLLEMTNGSDQALKVAGRLDSDGNTAKAVTKGIAIGLAGAGVLSLLANYISEVNSLAARLGLAALDATLTNPSVLFGGFVGIAVPTAFAGMLMLAVMRQSKPFAREIKRQFEEIPGLLEGKPGVRPDYDRPVEISTDGAMRELLSAGMFAIIVTMVVGLVFGANAILGYLYGSILIGLVLATFLSNAGGLYDNTKKYIEDGHHGGKGSAAHGVAIIVDTVGDSWKDTAGPSINTLLAVECLLASLCSGLFLTTGPLLGAIISCALILVAGVFFYLRSKREKHNPL